MELLLLSYPQNLTLVSLQNKFKIGFIQTRYVDTLYLVHCLMTFDMYCFYKEMKDTWNSLVLKYNVEHVVKQIFDIRNYYRWKIIEYKNIKTQINEYHKLLKDSKAENIILPNEFVLELLIEKLNHSGLITNNKWSANTRRCHFQNLLHTLSL